MGKRKSSIPFQPAQTDLATVAAAMNRDEWTIDFAMLSALRAGLIGTESPLKDAVERLWDREDAEREWDAAWKAYGDCLIDARKCLEKSVMDVEADKEYRALIVEQKVLIDRLIAACSRKMTGGQELLYHRRPIATKPEK